jgi:hypothetical protein
LLLHLLVLLPLLREQALHPVRMLLRRSPA